MVREVFTGLNMKAVGTVVILVLLSAVSFSQRTERLPRFEQHRTKVHSGKVKNPKWISFENGSARDELGKLTDTPHINFCRKILYFGSLMRNGM
jgi:hypothetical protein